MIPFATCRICYAVLVILVFYSLGITSCNAGVNAESYHDYIHDLEGAISNADFQSEVESWLDTKETEIFSAEVPSQKLSEYATHFPEDLSTFLMHHPTWETIQSDIQTKYGFTTEQLDRFEQEQNIQSKTQLLLKHRIRQHIKTQYEPLLRERIQSWANQIVDHTKPIQHSTVPEELLPKDAHVIGQIPLQEVEVELGNVDSPTELPLEDITPNDPSHKDTE